jgi:hypothetical protein
MKRIPWEEAVGVSEYQSVYAQVATHGYQSVFLAKVGIRKPEVIV